MSGGALAVQGRMTERVVSGVLRMIAAGEVEMGGRLPAQRELAVALGVSRDTLRRGLDELEQRGEIRRRPGRGGGTFATRPNPNWPMYSWSRLSGEEARRVSRPIGVDISVPAFLASQNFTVSTRVVFAGVEPADGRVSEGLGIDPGTPVIAIKRVRLADGTPLSWERMFVPERRFPGLLDLPLDASLTTVFREHYGVVAERISEHIMIRIAERQHEAHLDVTEGQPLLSIIRTSLDVDGRAFEFSYDLFRADRTVLSITSARSEPPSSPSRLDRLSDPAAQPT